jgi:hypothetical protein
MADYRAYIVGSDGHFFNSVEVECTDDDTVVEKAEQLVDGHDVELWQRACKIATFEHKPKMQF